MSDPADLMAVFREEARDNLAELSRLLLDLEGLAPGEAQLALVRSIFRAAHNLKGAAATVGAAEVAGLAHQLETSLDDVRKGRVELTSALVDAALAMVDAVRAHLEGKPVPEGVARLAATLGVARSSTGKRVGELTRARPRGRGAKERVDALLASAVTTFSELATDPNEASLERALAKGRQLQREFPAARYPLGARLLGTVNGALAQTAAASPYAVQVGRALLLAVDFLYAQVAGKGGEDEVSIIEAMVSPPPSGPKDGAASRSAVPPRAPEGVAPSMPAEAVEPSTVAASGSAGTVRVPVSVLDSVQYRLEEIVALKFRLDHQRRQLEDALSGLEHLSTGVGLTANDWRVAVEAERRRIAATRDGLVQDLHELALVTQTVTEDVKNTRLVSVGSLLDGARRAARDLARALGKDVAVELVGDDVRLDRRVLEMISDPLTHLYRNAVDHGIESPEERAAAGKPTQARLTIRVESREANVRIEVEDDGRGIDVRRIRQLAVEKGLVDAEQARSLSDREARNLIFMHGFSSARSVTDISGRGVGLDVVRENISRLGGIIEFYSDPGQGARFVLSVPLAVTATRGLLVAVGRSTYCLPLTSIEDVVSLEPEQVHAVVGRLSIHRRNQTVPFVGLEELLAGRGMVHPRSRIFCVILAVADRRLAVGVDQVLGQEEIVVRAPAAGTPKLQFVAGATPQADGRLITVLDPAALLDCETPPTAFDARRAREAAAVVLVADDSLTSRTLVSSVLERAGFRTLLARDGSQAWELLRQHQVDLVVSDVEMPGMDGFSLVRAMRSNKATASLPVILLTSLNSESDRVRGADAGADAYVIKAEFDPGAFLALVAEHVSPRRSA